MKKAGHQNQNKDRPHRQLALLRQSKREIYSWWIWHVGDGLAFSMAVGTPWEPASDPSGDGEVCRDEAVLEVAFWA